MRVFRPGISDSMKISWRTGLPTSGVDQAKGISENDSSGTIGRVHKRNVGQTNISKPGFINPAETKRQNPIYTAKPCSISPDFICSQNIINLFLIRNLRTFFGPAVDELYCGILS